MPEIWLNYGITDVVLDIKAENLEGVIDSQAGAMDDEAIHEKLEELDLSKQADLVVLHNSRLIQKVISMLFARCEQKSHPFPRILAQKEIISQVRQGLPEGSSINEFDSTDIDSNLIFISEVEFDGLFGYETVATRLIRRFGQDSMLEAYAKRQGNIPAAGQHTDSLKEAKKFADGFEIHGIEIVANTKGILDIVIGNPSKTLGATKVLEKSSIIEAEKQRALIISTGKDSSSDSLGAALASLWNCYNAVKKDGLAVLLAECKSGLRSPAIERHIEGRLTAGQLRNPPKYIDGMEDLLYLTEIQKSLQVGIVSILPGFYTKKLGMVSMPAAKYSLNYILKTQGARQKVSIVSDGARILLR